MKNFSSIVVFLLLAMTASTVFSAESGMGNAIGQLSYLEGRVDRRVGDGPGYNPVVKDDMVYAGDVLRTKGYSRAEISFNDKSIVKVGENSQVGLKEYTIGQDGARAIARLLVDRGVIRAIVSKSTTGEQNFFINTPNASGSVKGSDIGVSYLKSSSTFISMSGAIETHSLQFPDKAVMIAKGTTAFVPVDAAAQEARPFLSVEADHFRDSTAPLLARDSNITAADLSKAIITDFTGDVRIRRSGGQWHRAAIKETIGEGDEIETGENGGLRMVLESGRIVELGADTQLTIQKFSVDIKTGFREDLMTSARGEIRARIEKLKGGSKFQVITPTAIAAVRGTIMYLQVSPTVTHAFFEAGQGLLKSVVTGLEKGIEPGQNAKADNTGAVSDPVTTTPEQHQSLEGHFNSQEQTYHFSAPGGSSIDVKVNIPLDADFGGINGKKIDAMIDDVANSVVFNDVVLDRAARNKILDVISEAASFSGSVTEETGVFNFYSPDDESFYDEGYIDGLLAGIGSIWDAAKNHDVVGVGFGGIYIAVDNPQYLLWNLEFNSVNGNNDTQTTADGGAFKGFAGGISVGGDMIGYGKAIYVEPTAIGGQYKAGIMSSDNTNLIGQFGDMSAGQGLWLAAGPFSPVFKNTTNISPAELFDVDSDGLFINLESSTIENLTTDDYFSYGEGSFSIDGESSGYMYTDALTGHSLGIKDREKDQNWGIWSILIGGSYDLSENVPVDPASFTVAISGRVVDNNPTPGSTPSDTVFLGTIKGVWDSVDKNSGELSGVWVSLHNDSSDQFLEAGTLKGRSFGNAEETGEGYGYWQALAVGEYQRSTDRLGDDGSELSAQNAQDLYNSVANFINDAGYSGYVTEVMSSVASMSGQFNGTSSPISGTANVSFFGDGSGATSGIWTGLFNGTASGTSTNNWTVDVVGVDVSGLNNLQATLTGFEWQGNQWLATVNGTAQVNGATSFTGQAGGTYTNPDTAGQTTFEGVGVGTWQPTIA